MKTPPVPQVPSRLDPNPNPNPNPPLAAAVKPQPSSNNSTNRSRWTWLALLDDNTEILPGRRNPITKSNFRGAVQIEDPS